MTDYEAVTQIIENAAKAQKKAFDADDDPGYWLASVKLMQAFYYRNSLDAQSQPEDQSNYKNLLIRTIASEVNTPTKWGQELLGYFN
ncbi:MAG: hypothetical protein KAI17_03340 [Thiotrichaceae bacterium]|nr:hypothetical protein [Thiotrichaceae bacterium]